MPICEARALHLLLGKCRFFCQRLLYMWHKISNFPSNREFLKGLQLKCCCYFFSSCIVTLSGEGLKCEDRKSAVNAVFPAFGQLSVFPLMVDLTIGNNWRCFGFHLTIRGCRSILYIDENVGGNVCYETKEPEEKY